VSLVRTILPAAVALLASPADARRTVLHAGGGWAAIDFGGVCEARARSVLMAPKGKPQAVAGFAFTPDRRRWGELHARLSRVPRPGSALPASRCRQSKWTRTLLRTFMEMRGPRRCTKQLRFSDFRGSIDLISYDSSTHARALPLYGAA